MKKKMFLSELLRALAALILVAIPAASQVPEALRGTTPPEEFSPESLAKKFRQVLKETDYLEVSATYEAKYVNLPGAGKDSIRDPVKVIETTSSGSSKEAKNLVVINATAESEMRSDSFEAIFWRKDQMGNYPDGLTRLRLEPSESPGEMPTLHEWHYYPLLGGTKRENSFTTDNLHGAGDPSLPNPLFAEIPGACSSAELWFTWLGESSQAESFENIISDGQLVSLERFDERDAYRVERIAYEDEEEGGFFSYRQVFWLDHESGFLIGWRQERASLIYGKQSNYLVVTIVYHYDSSNPDENLPAMQSLLEPG